MAYAATTAVPVERSRAEIERLIHKFRCSQFMTGIDHENHQAIVQFKANERIVRFVLDLPDRALVKAKRESQRDYAVAQLERSRWRALLLVIKAKLEAVESHIATFEEEFLAHIVLPNDRTVGQVLTPMIAEAYTSGRMPKPLLLEAGQNG